MRRKLIKSMCSFSIPTDCTNSASSPDAVTHTFAPFSFANQRIVPVTRLDVDAIDAACVDLDQHLTAPQPGHGNRLEVERLWTTDMTNAKRTHRIGHIGSAVVGELRDAETVEDKVMLGSLSRSLQHDLGPAVLALVEVLIAT